MTKSVQDFALVVGNPARQIGWMSAYGERINLPLQGTGQWKCKKTGSVYKLKGDTMVHNSN